MELFAERRRRLLETIRGVAIVASMPVAARNSDIEHPYRQDSDLYYFTGFEEPDAVLLMSSVHPEHHTVMFVRPRDAEREQWEGSRVGVEGAKERLGVDVAYPMGELAQRLPDYLMGAPELHYQIGHRPKLDEKVLAAMLQARGRTRSPQVRPRRIIHPEETWHEARLRKDARELELMRRAAAISMDGFREVMRATKPGSFEYEVGADLTAAFERRGAERVAFQTIIASGPNATVLHYVSNRRRIEPGDLVVLDAGCEYGYYASDITRTWPVSGRFTAPQRALYQVVLDAQLAALAACRPGATVDGIHKLTIAKLVEGMVGVGLMRGAVDDIVQSDGFKRYYMHRTSHWLGLDVHDVGAYYVDGQSRVLEPGMVLTIEPGLYVGVSDEQAPAELRGIGIRIEDSVIVTADGHENLTAALPKTVAEVEAFCAG